MHSCRTSTDDHERMQAIRYDLCGKDAATHVYLQREVKWTLQIDDRLPVNIACSSENARELAVGRLISCGIIRSLKEIDALMVYEDDEKILVSLKEGTRDECMSQERARTKRSIASNWIFRLSEVFALDRTSHMMTHGTHSAQLASEGGILCVMEDIGRHNAFDKAVGWALLNDVVLDDCMIFTSGRVPKDMVMKSIESGISALISKSVATDQAVSLARERGLALICNALPGSFEVLAGEDRIV